MCRAKDWGAYEIKGLAIERIDIVADNVQIDIGEGVEIRLLSIGSVFKPFQVSKSWQWCILCRVGRFGSMLAHVLSLFAAVVV